MAKKASGGSRLKVAQRALLLSDDVPRKLLYDFSALEAFEEVMGSFASLSGKNIGVGNVRAMGAWAYALTASWREDHEDPITYREFKRLLPTAPNELERVTSIVAAVIAEATTADNDGENPPAPAPEPPTE